MIGRIVGNYRVAEKLGEGGMGAVYRAVDLMLERDVALKAIRPELAREPQIVERFKSEARTLARISHSGIANVYTFFYEEDELFLVMELVRGRTLSRVLQTEGAIPWQHAVSCLASALEGIEQAHRAGIVHRDLKPDNLILTDSGTVKVMDFGIARVIGSGHLTRTGLLVGTLRYMSPEQIRGEEVDGRSDVYALGAVLYEMLTGRPPFEGASDWAILRAQIEDTPRPPGEQVPSIPWWLDRAVLRALAKNPAERFQTVEEMRRTLLRQAETQEGPHPAGIALADLPTVVTPPGSRQTPAPLDDSMPRMTPPPTLPSMASLPTTASVRQDTPPLPRTPPPLPGGRPAAATPPPPPTSTPARIVPPPPPAAAVTPPTSYRPVELTRPGGGAGRKVALIVLALFAFAGVVFVGLLVLSNFLPKDSPATGAATPAATLPDSSTPPPAHTAANSPEAVAQDEEQEEPEPALSTEPAAAPIRSPSSATRQAEPMPEPATSEEAAASEEPTAETNAPAEPPAASAQGPVEEIHRLAGEIETQSAELVERYGEFLSHKEDSGAELTDNDQKLKDDLDDLQEAAEKFNGQFQVGFFGRLRGRRADDRRRIGQNFRELGRLAGEVDQLMGAVRPSSEVRQNWQEVRHRWRRVADIVSGF
jgi:serine/threonine-protein kinase